MVALTIDFIGDDATINDSVREWLTEAGFRATNASNGSNVWVQNVADCEQLGAHLSLFVAERSDPFKLRIDGPGGDSLIHEVRMVADADSMTHLLATSAYLQ
ncbi:hypothetical protein AB0K35_31260 [Micromonospora sp. NPDC053740]|uniref:hypothetical protein n=1 Tax=Micromonospora TaxID=1873 RepID=UPI001EE97DAA|nr:hypothetical protein [Micromonospora alfalfae]MCG5462918.1 hypothetical protein [Micromonospora alfalfae]